MKSVDHSPWQQSSNNIMIKKKRKRSGNILQKFNTVKRPTTQLSLNHFHYLEGKKKKKTPNLYAAMGYQTTFANTSTSCFLKDNEEGK